jgi:hypothetical protein
MKRFVVAILASWSCFVFFTARGGPIVILGVNYIVSQPTDISAIGARDGGTGFTFTETVGIFNDLTGAEVGPVVVFGPGETGVQVGDVFYERFPSFVLSPGDYSIISLRDGSTSTAGFGGLIGNTYAEVGADVILPEGDRFNFGTDFGNRQYQPFFLINLVPDGGTTAILLGASLAGLAWLRRKF